MKNINGEINSNNQCTNLFNNDLFHDLTIQFIKSVLNLEEKFQDFRYKKSKIILYSDIYIDLENLLCLFSFFKIIKSSFKFLDVILMNEDNIFFKLDNLMNHIIIPNILFSKKGIGILPIKKSCICTKGFKWDIGIFC